jgi:hypothetical protein
LLLTLAIVLSPPAAAAEAVRETRPAAGFSRIEIVGDAEVTLRQGTTEGVTLEASQQALRGIDTEVDGRTLSITLTDSRKWWDWVLGGTSTRTPRITIDLIRLDRVEIAGSVRLSAAAIKTDDLRIEVAGACTLDLPDLRATRLRLEGAGAVNASIAGKVATQDIELSGAGTYDAGELVSDDARVEVNGAGKALVNAARSLKVTISGAGRVSYLGNPKLQQDITGVGRVVRADSP